jgi:hypothetical protein
MKIKPKNYSTKVDPITKEWIPASFETLLSELEHIESRCKSNSSLPLFRGHRDRNWLLDSTFARSFKERIFDLSAGEKLSDYVLNTHELHLSVLNLFLLKYGVLVRPNPELESLAVKENIDSWFELMKKFQQYTDEDSYFIKGTNLIDWSQSFDIALYFANQNRLKEGAVFICDSTATGKTLQTKPLGAILDKMNEIGNSGKQLGIPLMFCPKRQIANERARNQKAIYFAQMDLRYDLETIWRMQEQSNGNETIIVKVIVPENTQEDVEKHLISKGVTEKYIYPDM